jgi:hypothetical protein
VVQPERCIRHPPPLPPTISQSQEIDEVYAYIERLELWARTTWAGCGQK